MADPLKDRYTRYFVVRIMAAFVGAYTRYPDLTFPQQEFLAQIFDEDWETLELKQRMARITEAIYDALPKDYPLAIEIILAVAKQFDGFLYMCFPGYVEKYGLEDWETSMDLLKAMTPHASAEFAIRPFLIAEQERTLERMEAWAKDENHHVRRLASEGCRPRLPWAMALPALKQDPTPLLPILALLHDDPSEYVRRSAANNLNDISKDHPEVAYEVIQSWLQGSKESQKTAKHGARTLLKAGHTETLQLFGFSPPDALRVEALSLDTDLVPMGGMLEFSFRLTTDNEALGKLRVEYGVYYKKARGHLSRKIFQLSESTCEAPERSFVRKHRFQDLSTRKHYPGAHKLSIVVNGRELAEAAFELVED